MILSNAVGTHQFIYDSLDFKPDYFSLFTHFCLLPYGFKE